MGETALAPPRIHVLADLSADERAGLLTRAEDDLAPFMERIAPVIEAVRAEGDAALVRYAREFDGAEIDRVAATPADFEAAFEALDPQLVDTLRYAADNICRYHEAQKPEEMWMKEIRPGVLVGERWTPVDAAAAYAPRGKGSFPSVVLMTLIPAVVAGVRDLYLLTPPGPDGTIDAATLVAARIAGCERVFMAGGAVAVAAAAYGTDTIPRAHLIEGPGSPWFVAAKRLLTGRIDTGLPAGPSESVLLADETANAEVAALDTIIESEHGADSSVFLVTTSRELAAAVQAAIPRYWQDMSDERAGYSSAVLSGTSGGIVLAETLSEAYDFINDYAPEHCQVLSERPFEHLAHIRNASEILLGQWAAGSMANYLMGPNCVLPTAAAARTRSPLGVTNFMKSCSIGHATKGGFDEMGPHTARFATYEGFDGHAAAVGSKRLEALGNER